jgi:uncharacterized ubiquitin-like protein YukD
MKQINQIDEISNNENSIVYINIGKEHYSVYIKVILENLIKYRGSKIALRGTGYNAISNLINVLIELLNSKIINKIDESEISVIQTLNERTALKLEVLISSR